MNGIVWEASLFAEAAHRGQVRKYTLEPYIVHPCEVAKIVSTLPGATDEMIAAAWLHDVVEDTAVESFEIERRFGGTVRDLVSWLTDVSRPSHCNRAARKAIDREHLSCAPGEAQTIKLADLISNTSTIAQCDPKFAKMYLAEKRALLEVLTRGNPTLHAIASAMTKGLNLTGGGK